MNFSRFYSVVMCAAASVVFVACADDRSEQTSTVVGATTGARCSSVRIVSPAHTATHPIDSPVLLQAQADCPDGAGQFQFWVRPNGAHDWTKLGGYGASTVSWDAPSSGAWQITAVAHPIGAT